MFQKIKILILSGLLVLTIAGCSDQGSQNESSSPANSSPAPTQSSGIAASSAPKATSSQASSSEVESSASDENSTAASTDAPTTTARELTVHFGDDGAPFTMYLYDNSTAAAIADYVGTADWRLPIYNFDGYDNWEVMQYYDLPSRYEIPSNAETVTAEKSGEVYYSEPNRIVLFYGDAEVSGEYTRIGYFEATENFVSAVQNNPVLEGWGNKIVLIKD